MNMASLLVGRCLSFNSGRQSVNLCLSSRCWQQTYAACAPTISASRETQVASYQGVTPVFRKAAEFKENIALRDVHGDYTYRGIYLSSRQLASEITEKLRGKRQERVVFLCPNDATYLITQWACWMSGQIAVPVSSLHPPSVLEYFVNDSDANLIITTPDHAPVMADIASKTKRELMILDETLRVLAQRQPPKPAVMFEDGEKCNWDEPDLLLGGQELQFYENNDALMLYTSGTTGSPKGVLLSYSNLEAQVMSLVTAWEWTHKDIILHTLPLHHMHGIVNALLCPLYVGARCVMLPRFEVSRVWSYLLAIHMPANERINMYMAVPTIYMKLIEEYDKIFSKNERMKEYIKAVCSQKIRLMVSGSAPLPTPVFHRWEEITGHRLLERYGMTEAGMILSNPIRGERKPGFVGKPLPGVQVKLAPPSVPSVDDSKPGLLGDQGTVGELLVKGPGVFKNYWRRPNATEKNFTPDRWFKTGDTAEIVNGEYRLLGRTSIDIIKTGGYKVSAVEVETHLLGHPNISDCSVVGLPDMTWGQKVAAVVVPREGKEVLLSELREWAKEKMPSYAVPTVLKCVDKIPKNALGKVNKKDLLQQIFPKNKASP